MVEAGKKVNFYRLALERGKMHRMTLSEDYRLIGQGGGTFCYLSPMYDSNDFEGTWHRLRLNGTFSNCKYEVIAAATDANLEAVLTDEELSFSDKMELLKNHSHIRKVNTDDMLLHALQGRYLWVMITVMGSKIDSSFCMDGFSVEFPQSSFVEYLPEIYQDERNSFFERYMSVWQSMYEDLEKEVDAIPQYLDYETAPDENLVLFAEWTGRWNQKKRWTPKQLRELIAHLQQIQCGRGTWKVMEQMITFLTGQKAVIIEHFQWKNLMKEGASELEEYYQLYGKSEDTFVVMIDAAAKDVGMSEWELERFLDDYTPLGMICKVVYLKKNSQMDSQSYLDKDTYLSTPINTTTEDYVLGDGIVL